MTLLNVPKTWREPPASRNVICLLQDSAEQPTTHPVNIHPTGASPVKLWRPLRRIGEKETSTSAPGVLLAVPDFLLPLVIPLTIGLPVTTDASLLLQITGVVRESIDKLIIDENLPILQENIGNPPVATDANYHLARLPVNTDEILNPVTIVIPGVNNIFLSIIVVIQLWENIDGESHLQVCPLNQ
jgi:hypothetical protein